MSWFHLLSSLIGGLISPTEVGNATTELKAVLEKWRTRDLSPAKIKYLIVDGVNFRIRIGGSLDIVPILVVMGVREDNGRLILLIKGGDKESPAPWREPFRDLKRRGRDGP